jgi:hypothetical protein
MSSTTVQARFVVDASLAGFVKEACHQCPSLGKERRNAGPEADISWQPCVHL